MSKFLLLIFFTVFVIKVSSAQTTYTWAGGATGDYQDQTNWTPARTTRALPHGYEVLPPWKDDRWAPATGGLLAAGATGTATATAEDAAAVVAIAIGTAPAAGTR